MRASGGSGFNRALMCTTVALLITACSQKPPTQVAPAVPNQPVKQYFSDEATEVQATHPPELPAPEIEKVGVCRTPRPAADRRGGDLVVSSPPARIGSVATRFRTHSYGDYTAGRQRTWIGMEVPIFMPLTDDDRELFLLDQTSDGLLAFYRSMYGSSSCSLNSPANCSYSVNMFTCNGEKKWSVDLAPFFSRPDHLEIQDIHYDGSTLYFNEACQSYSRESQGKCSSIVAIDPANRKLLWRSKPLVSNNRFEIVDDYILSAYAFTTESTSAYVIRRSDGKVMEQARVQANNLNVAVSSNAVTFSNYDGLEIQYRLHDSTTAKPKLKKEHEYRPPPAPPPTYHPPHWRPRPPIDF